MFEELDPPKDKEPTDYTGLKIVGAVAPVFFLFFYFDKAQMGLVVTIVLGMTILAAKLRWRLHKHFWFWATIALILALHVPLIPRIRWEDSRVPTLVYAAPLGFLDFFLIMGALQLAENLFSKRSPSEDVEE